MIAARHMLVRSSTAWRNRSERRAPTLYYRSKATPSSHATASKNSFPRQQQLGSSARPANPPIAIVVRRFIWNFENVQYLSTPGTGMAVLKDANDPNVPNPAYICRRSRYVMGRVVVPSIFFRVSDRPIGPELAASLMVTTTVPSRGPPFTPDGRSRRSSVTPCNSPCA